MTVAQAGTLKLPHFCTICHAGYIHGVVWVDKGVLVICTDCLKSSFNILGNLQKDAKKAIKEEIEQTEYYDYQQIFDEYHKQ